MTRTILFLILLATLATPASLTAEPTPSTDRPSRKNAKKEEELTLSRQGVRSTGLPSLNCLLVSIFDAAVKSERGPEHG